MRRNQKPIQLCFVMPGAYQLFHTDLCVEHGGAELNLYYLSKMFALDERYQVSFLVEDQGQKHIEYYEKVRVIRLTGLRIGKNKPKGKLENIWLRLVIEFSTAYEMITNRYDCVLVTTGSLILPRVILWGQFLGKKQVVFRFANDYDADPHHFAAFGESKWKDRIYWWGLKRARVLVFQTKQQEKLLERQNGQASTIIPNGFSIPNSPITVKKDIILWVSRSSDIKRPELFLEMAKRLPHEKFVMIMPGENEVSARIQQLLIFIPNIRFLHYVPFDRIQEYFDQAKLFVNTSTSEGFPNTFIQCGIGMTPILSFCIDPDHMIERHQLGCLCNDSIEGAVQFVQSLDEDSIRTYGRHIRNYTLETHDIKKTFLQYEKLFRRLYTREKLCRLNSFD